MTNLSTQSLIKGFIWLGETHHDASPSIGLPAFLSHSKHSEMHTLSTHVQTNTHVICHCCTVCVSTVLVNVVFVYVSCFVWSFVPPDAVGPGISWKKKTFLSQWKKPGLKKKHDSSSYHLFFAYIPRPFFLSCPLFFPTLECPTFRPSRVAGTNVSKSNFRPKQCCFVGCCSESFWNMVFLYGYTLIAN